MNDSINRLDPLGLFYEEVFTLGWQLFREFKHTVKGLVDGKTAKVNRTVIDVGLAVTGQIAEAWGL